jgi:hypothetical protein
MLKKWGGLYLPTKRRAARRSRLGNRRERAGFTAAVQLRKRMFA